MSGLKDYSIFIEDGMQTFFPQWQETKTLPISSFIGNITPKSYSYNNGVIAFVDEDKDFYVIPNFKGTQKILVEEGYKKDHFYVPFSNWDYPVACSERWEYLLELRHALEDENAE